MTPKRILVVDDDATTRRLHSHILKREGYDVVTASDGLQAFEMLAEVRPDAVVTDGQMPRMDGAGLLRMIRRSPETADLPVLVVTNSEDERDAEEAACAGATAFLKKPVGSTELVATLQRALLAGPGPKSEERG